ncbi:MAG: hypothetical protein AB8G05_10155 [Oligoflexales bacterium]
MALKPSNHLKKNLEYLKYWRDRNELGCNRNYQWSNERIGPILWTAYIDADGTKRKDSIAKWIELATGFVKTLPKK